ncbi:MAG: exodeoxyribonuclease VII large subunit [Holophagaceae bacterium]
MPRSVSDPLQSDLQAPLSVSFFLEHLKKNTEPRYRSLYLVGEVSAVKSSGGHLYFNLKEDNAAVSCAIWRTVLPTLKHLPKDGDRIILQANLSIYIPRGTMTLAVTYCELAGQGDLQAKLKQLEAQLRIEGVFDRPRKDLPRSPQKIGVIAALGGAALQDVLRVTGRRAPGMDVLIFPAAAQGERCVPENLQMLEEAQQPHWGCDVLLMVRGGGSPEDLWGFNDPDLVRAVAACRLPLVTGVGHEIDTTLVDLASDQRAATPSQAAELITTERNELSLQVLAQVQELIRVMTEVIGRCETEFNLLSDRDGLYVVPDRITQLGHKLEMQQARLAAKDPIRRVELFKTQLTYHTHRLNQFVIRPFVKERYLTLTTRLASLNPEAPLSRGFVLTLDTEGRPITSAAQVQIGEELQLKWADGTRAAQIVKPTKP